MGLNIIILSVTLFDGISSAGQLDHRVFRSKRQPVTSIISKLVAESCQRG